ncbi:Uncharacterised protein [Mycobacteroides abscessus subsp. abscessus]|nr:Uncharacterised protein [Mycobacteroides abscessus subsp. abscessus]
MNFFAFFSLAFSSSNVSSPFFSISALDEVLMGVMLAFAANLAKFCWLSCRNVRFGESFRFIILFHCSLSLLLFVRKRYPFR